MSVLPSGFSIGHWTDTEALTGCTVILCPEKTVGGCDVRGNSPGSRELALLASEKSMQEVHAVLLSGGSAFGLAAADGVMRFLEEQGIGYRTPWGRVPIVPTAVIFDLNIGTASVRPTSASGYAACLAAGTECAERGSIGVGVGATVGKWGGIQMSMPGGFGIHSIRLGDLVVTAVAAVNAIGDVMDAGGKIIAGARLASGQWLAEERSYTLSPPLRVPDQTNTTLVALLTNAVMSKVDANRLAQRAHDGMARAIKPVHTSHDGDITFALSAGPIPSFFESVAEMGADAAAEAIRDAVCRRP
jgi:L-aminopeptidase/D-esterase-like protein